MKNFEIPKMTVSFFTKEEILTESTPIPDQPQQLQAIDQFNQNASNSLVGRASFTALMELNK